MKLLTLVTLLVLSSNLFADVMYSYTYKNQTEKCSVDIFVPTKGKIKVERLCFNLSK